MPVRSEPDPPKGSGVNRSTKQQAQDDLVMATNSSSIVSKRSVERIYYPNERHFFRFFVKKFQRRAPLINRGYHLRMHIIDVAVRRFLQRPSEKKKVVVNLGCGSDVLPWQCLSRYPDHCHGVKFVDIDFPDLMAKKCKIVQETPELRSPLSGLKTTMEGHLMLQSDQYAQIGCDLRDLVNIEETLAQLVSLPDSEFLFVAEVSITYMETEATDSVIKWAGSLGQAEFCLLEQILPDGPDHPFAKTMLHHFDKLKTPLKSVFAYPTLEAQRRRFSELGWTRANVENLWQIWSNNQWISPEERRALDDVEPFDEWEEFALFAGHYCVVAARTGVASTGTTGSDEGPLSLNTDFPVISMPIQYGEHDGSRGQRRFGAPMSFKDSMGQQIMTNTFGLGTNSRLRSYDLHGKGTTLQDIEGSHPGPSGRMCHAITDLGDHGCLLSGGRASPASALRDCWLFNRQARTWVKSEDLPLPLYRHAITRLGHAGMALLVGGKTGSSSIFSGCLIYRPGSGWVECKISGSAYRPTFGATLVSINEVRVKSGEGSSHTAVAQFEGILAGGMLHDGTISKRTMYWNLILPMGEGCPTITFTPIMAARISPGDDGSKTAPADVLVNRFGASVLLSRDGRIFLIGGVIHGDILPEECEVLALDASESSYRILGTYDSEISPASSAIPRPILVGVSVSMDKDDDALVIMGGGATCFSMGTCWNRGCYTIPQFLANTTRITPRSDVSSGQWKFLQLLEVTEEPPVGQAPVQSGQTHIAKVDIPRVRIHDQSSFIEVLKRGKPVVIEGNGPGVCVKTWTPEYLTQKVGCDRKVTIHKATHSKMDFNAKNFAYVTMPFGDFMQGVAQGNKMYLRALSEDQPADQPTDLKTDFPQLADEFQLPEELSFVSENAFSSVLRVSGRVNMWLHYDVMANVYCQIVGSKRLVLFPPSDVAYLPFAPGASSSSIDVFSALESSSSSLAQTHPYEAVLNPGDILFLPPLWLHTAMPLTDLGVAVNVFFRNLESGYSSGRDVYGNRDLAAYEKGRQDVARIANAFGKLPPDMRAFYLARLADELKQKSLGVE